MADRIPTLQIGCITARGNGLKTGLSIEIMPLPPLTRSPFHLTGTASNVANRPRLYNLQTTNSSLQTIPSRTGF